MPIRRALLIGNSTFRHSELARLSAPANDVRELAELLEDPKIGGFETELKLDIGLVDARLAIKRLFQDNHPDDLILFYYSGHGLLDERGRFYLAMTETDPEDPDAGSIDEFWLRDVFDGSASGRQVAILDCCHSGALIPDDVTSKDAATRPLLNEKILDPTGRGRFIMAATTASTSAFEQDGQSLYTRHLVEGLTEGAAAPENDTVSIFDLHRFIKDRVVETAPASMEPQLWRDASKNPDDSGLVIAFNPKPRPKLPNDDVTHLWSDDTEKVELAIFRLIFIAQSDDDPRKDDAQKVLRERLEASETLSYKLGALIVQKVGTEESEARIAELKNKIREDQEYIEELESQISEAKSVIDSERKDRDESDEKFIREINDLNLRSQKNEDNIELVTNEFKDLNEENDTLKNNFARQEIYIRNLRSELEQERLKQTGLRALDLILYPLSQIIRPTRIIILVILFFGIYTVSDADRLDRTIGSIQALFPFAFAPQGPVLDEQSRVTVQTRNVVAAQKECTAAVVDACEPGTTVVEASGFPEMVVLPKGAFLMGSEANETDRFRNEGPVRVISINRFALARTEVTVGQWRLCVSDGFCRQTDEDEASDPLPVISVSWIDSQVFIEWLNSKVEGQPYRLPSEAEWEYAARAGALSRFPWGDEWDSANANGNLELGRSACPRITRKMGLVSLI